MRAILYHRTWLYDCHDAYRAYAAYLNRRRPHGRKLSWRGLSRPQKRAAIDWIERMLPIGGVPVEHNQGATS